jgi:CBS domain-containing protein
MFVRNVMTPSITTSEPEVSVKEAAELMTKLKIGSLLVMKEGELVGIVTESDITRKVVSKGLDVKKTKLSDIMTKKVITIDANEKLDEACKVMNKYKIKKLPVLKDGELVGILTNTDIVSYEPKMAGYIYKIISKREKKEFQKNIKPILYTNFLLILLLIASVIIFSILLNPLLSHPTITQGVAQMIYAFIVVLILISSITGIIIFKIISRKTIF